MLALSWRWTAPHVLGRETSFLCVMSPVRHALSQSTLTRALPVLPSLLFAGRAVCYCRAEAALRVQNPLVFARHVCTILTTSSGIQAFVFMQPPLPHAYTCRLAYTLPFGSVFVLSGPPVLAGIFIYGAWSRGLLLMGHVAVTTYNVLGFLRMCPWLPVLLSSLLAGRAESCLPCKGSVAC